jgi:hypothetical protein
MTVTIKSLTLAVASAMALALAAGTAAGEHLSRSEQPQRQLAPATVQKEPEKRQNFRARRPDEIPPWEGFEDCPMMFPCVGMIEPGFKRARIAPQLGDLTWAEGDFRAGDVLTFSSHTVHRALPNCRPEQVRLSCDVRYHPLSEEINDRSQNVHCDVLSWEEVYADWPAGWPQWYWRDHSFHYSPWNEELRWQKDKIC